jgi:hypothetical protein
MAQDIGCCDSRRHGWSRRGEQLVDQAGDGYPMVPNPDRDKDGS